MKKQNIRKKLRKHERPRWRYLLILKGDGERVKRILKDSGILYKEIELVVKSLIEKQIGRLILRVKREDIESIKKMVKEENVKIANVSGTLKGLLK
jgi:hypothetical protein